MDYSEYVKILDKYLNLTKKQKILLLFILLDENEDGYICNADIFTFLK